MNADAKADYGRSPRWPAARAAHLRVEPACAACGGVAFVEVHHVQPFHIYPARELDPANLITLCEAPGRDCHYVFGHAFHWRGWVASVREDVAAFRARFTESAALAATPAAIPQPPPPPAPSAPPAAAPAAAPAPSETEGNP